jgi:hypothetical protein
MPTGAPSGQDAVLPAQAAELLALLGGQALPLAGVNLRLPQPVAQRERRDAEVACDLGSA